MRQSTLESGAESPCASCEPPADISSVSVFMAVPTLRTRAHYPYASYAGGDMEEICGFGSPGELVSLGFALEADRDVTDVVVEATELTGTTASVPQRAVDLHVVRVWDQAGLGVYRAARVRVG